MENLKLGIQMYALREDFHKDPYKTFKMVKEMGYSGVEFDYTSLELKASDYKAALIECGLECYGVLADWEYLQPDALADVMRYNHELGNDKLIIGAVPPEELVTAADAPVKVLSYMKELYTLLSKDGFVTGYHNHDSDFTMRYKGVPFYEYVMENTSDDFLMVLDTGNAMAGGANPIDLIKKYPNRTNIIHIKGYSQDKKYLTPIWESDIDWKDVIDTAIKFGKAKFIDVEFGLRGEYIPMERAELSAKWLIQNI